MIRLFSVCKEQCKATSKYQLWKNCERQRSTTRDHASQAGILFAISFLAFFSSTVSLSYWSTTTLCVRFVLLLFRTARLAVPILVPSSAALREVEGKRRHWLAGEQSRSSTESTKKDGSTPQEVFQLPLHRIKLSILISSSQGSEYCEFLCCQWARYGLYSISIIRVLLRCLKKFLYLAEYDILESSVRRTVDSYGHSKFTIVAALRHLEEIVQEQGLPYGKDRNHLRWDEYADLLLERTGSIAD